MIEAQLALVLVIVELSDCRPEITLNIDLIVKFHGSGALGEAQGIRLEIVLDQYGIDCCS